MENEKLEKICIVCHREFPRSQNECPDDLVKLSEKDMRIGTTFDGKYEILDFVGAGGISRVYKARHKELNRIVALKILKLSGQIDLQRFRLEAVSVGKLEHPNIAKVYAFNVASEGVPYMALEYLDGRDLAENLARSGPLNTEAALEVFEQVASALEHAHDAKIIHRDIKPGNIILLANPEESVNVKVVDFGMAKLQADRLAGSSAQKLTLEGEIIGTRRYISPEQYRGAVPDERADIYSLGVSLQESVMKEGKVPLELRAMINKACDPNPSLRFQTVKELKAELGKIRESLSLSQGGVDTQSNKGETQRDLFGTFYFWSIVTGIITIAICATVTIKQRLDALSLVSQDVRQQKTRISTPLSLAATENQARVLSEKGKPEEAAKLYENWLSRNSNAGKRKELMHAYMLSAQVQSALGNPDAAENLSRQGLAMAQTQDLKKAEEYTGLLMALALIEYGKKDYEKSLDISEEILRLCRDQNSNQLLDSYLNALFTKSRCLMALHKLDEAKAAINDGLKLSQEKYGSLSTSYGEGSQVMAEILSSQSDYKQALSYVDKSVTSYKRNGQSFNGPYLSALALRAYICSKLDLKAEVEHDYEILRKLLLRYNHYNPALEKQLKTKINNLANYLNKDERLTP